MPANEGHARYDATAPFHTFLFDLEDGHMIDGGVGGNESRFLNHSCRPNCEAVIDRGRIFIHARRAIAAGRELFLDYGFEPDGASDPGVRASYPCRCGAPGCRGTMVVGS